MNENRFSIRTLQARMNQPKIDRPKRVCQHFHHVSQLIRSTSDPGDCYTDSYYYCAKMKHRITKKNCAACPHYKTC